MDYLCTQVDYLELSKGGLASVDVVSNRLILEYFTFRVKFVFAALAFLCF